MPDTITASDAFGIDQAAAISLVSSLTPRECEVVEAIAMGAARKEIATDLGLAP